MSEIKYIFKDKNDNDNIQKFDNGIIFSYDAWDDYGFKTSFNTSIVVNGNIIARDLLSKVGFIDGKYDDSIEDEEKECSTYYFLDKKGIVGKVIDKFPEDVFLDGLNLKLYRILKDNFDNDTVKNILNSTNDIFYNKEKLEKFEKCRPRLFSASIFRDYTEDEKNNLITQLRRFIKTGKKFIDYKFKFIYKDFSSGKLWDSDEVFSFCIENGKNKILPFNTNAIIGRNGIGKTSLLKDIVKASSVGNSGYVCSTFLPNCELCLNIKTDDNQINKIVSLLYISFSDFDLYDDTFKKSFNNPGFKFIGNRDLKDIDNITSPKDFSDELANICFKLFNAREKMKLLDDIINQNFGWDPYICDFYNKLRIQFEKYQADETEFKSHMSKSFINLSSGQKIILAIIFNAIFSSSENSIILVDEPELYLHSPYVLSLVTSLNNIALYTNSACIMTTHSAIPLQELTNDRIFIINESKENETIKKTLRKPEMQTYGANIQQINDEIFGFDIRMTGYYRRIKEINEEYNQEKIDYLLNSGKLGSDAFFYLNFLNNNGHKK